jgi:hypothetical protein
MDQLAIHECQATVQRRGELARLTGTAALISFALVLASVAVVPRLALDLAVACVLCAAVAAIARAARQELIERLAADSDAYCIPEVRRYGGRLTASMERRRLANSIDGLVAAPGPCTITLSDRVDANADELRLLADELRSPETNVNPASIALCRRLLTRAASSPLYNDRLPPDDLTAALRRIRSGVNAG